MGKISDSESEEIQRNLERFMDQQIKEYKYTKGETDPLDRAAKNTYKSMEIDVPNLEAPRAGRQYSYIDVDREGYSNRSYDDDLDYDFDPDPPGRASQKKRSARRGENDRRRDREPVHDEIYDDPDAEYDERERRRAEKEERRRLEKEEKRRAAEMKRQKKAGAGYTEPDNPGYTEDEYGPVRERPQKIKKKKKHRLLKFFIFLIILLAIIAGGIYFAWRFLVGDAYDKMTYREAKRYTATALKEDGVTNILLLGNDSRDNADDGRTDSIMLLTINRSQKKIYLTSFLRDIKVDIPGKGINRLNQSYAFGGPELVMRTLSEQFDIKISRYMLVNFQAFAKLADAVGGIDMEVTAEEVDWINAYLWEYNDINGDDIHKDNFPDGTSGNVHLNGPQALAYCRNRYMGMDFERSNRQKKVISAIVQKLPKALTSNFGGVMNGLFPNLTTSLTKDDCYDLSLLLLEFKDYEIVQSTVPQEHTWKFETYNEMELISIDFDANKKYLKQIMSASK